VIIDPSTHYDALYWGAQKPYRYVLPDGSIETRQYAGPALWWDGAAAICGTLADALGIPAGASLIDIGCGAGCFVAGFLGRGIDGYGVDISEHAIAHAPFAVKDRVRHGDAIAQAFDRAYDVCTAFDLVEHIYLADQGKLWDAFNRTGARTLALDIGTAHLPEHVWCPEAGSEIPISREWQSVSGHIAVLPIEFWRSYARTFGWLPDEPAMERFEAWRVSQPGYDAMEAWGRRNVLLLRR